MRRVVVIAGVLVFGCSVETAQPRAVEVSEAPEAAADASPTLAADDGQGYGACHSRHWSECPGPRTVCMFSPAAHDERWSVCSQTCDDVTQCRPGPEGGTAPVRCKPIIKAPRESGACVLDCEGGQTCPNGMVCSQWLGICAHAQTSESAPV